MNQLQKSKYPKCNIPSDETFELNFYLRIALKVVMVSGVFMCFVFI